METTTTTEQINDIQPAWQDVAAASASAEDRAAQAAMPPRRFEEILPCKLTDEELRERGDELAKVLDVVDAIEIEKKAAVDRFKARISIQEERARELRKAITSKSEDREVECVESFELRLGVARTTRVDTGEQIRERALRSSELQPTLPSVDDSPQMNLADAVDDDGGGPDLDEPADGDGETEITEPEAIINGSANDESEEKPRRGRRAKA